MDFFFLLVAHARAHRAARQRDERVIPALIRLVSGCAAAEVLPTEEASIPRYRDLSHIGHWCAQQLEQRYGVKVALALSGDALQQRAQIVRLLVLWGKGVLPGPPLSQKGGAVVYDAQNETWRTTHDV